MARRWPNERFSRRSGMRGVCSDCYRAGPAELAYRQVLHSPAVTPQAPPPPLKIRGARGSYDTSKREDGSMSSEDAGRGWDDETKSRINPFDWNSKSTGFGEIMHPSQSHLAKGGIEGGFDDVIGNPPYVRQELLGEFKNYFQQHYEVYHGIADLYAYFIEKGVSLLKPGGLFSYIVANKWMRANYGEPLRRWMKKQRIEGITDFGDLPVFETATTYPCILRIGKGKPASKFPACS